MTAQTAGKDQLQVPKSTVPSEGDGARPFEPDALRRLFLEHGRQLVAFAAWERQTRLLQGQQDVMSIASRACSGREMLPPLTQLIQGAFPVSSCCVALAE